MKKFFSKIRISFTDAGNQIKSNGKIIFFTVFFSFIVMFIVGLTVFFSSVHGPEQVMVPDVKGKTLVSALVEMQEKELYPKIQLKYSEETAKGRIIDQNPAPGAIVKAYRRVVISVSRGEPVEMLPDYTGTMIDQTIQNLELTFGGESALIKTETVYAPDSAPKGTIIAQDPEEGTDINEIEKIVFVVSQGE